MAKRKISNTNNKKLKITDDPQNDIRNRDIRKFIVKQKNKKTQFDHSPCFNERKGSNDKSERQTFQDIKKPREKQSLLTDQQRKFHISKEKLGMFNHKPQSYEQVVRMLKEKEEKNEIKNKKRKLKKEEANDFGKVQQRIMKDKSQLKITFYTKRQTQ